MAGRNVPKAKPLTTRYARGFGLAAVVWLVSVFVPTPYRFGLWAIGLSISFATPITAGDLHGEIPPHALHLPERFGLFTIIVLGEAIVAVVTGVADQTWSAWSVAAAVGGVMIAVSLWWVYFDNLDRSAIRAAQQEGETVLYQEWLYLHLPLVVGLTATGVGVEHVLTSELRAPLPAGERWLLCGALALCLFTLSALHHTTDTYTDRGTRIQSLYRSGAGAVVMLVAIVGTGLTSITIVGFLAVICVIQIVFDLREREPRIEVVPND